MPPQGSQIGSRLETQDRQAGNRSGEKGSKLNRPPKRPAPASALLLALTLLLTVSSGCAPMHHRGGAVLTWQRGAGLGGAVAGCFGIGSPQLFERYGVALGGGAELAYDDRFGLNGSAGTPEVHFFFGGAQPWAAHVMLSFSFRLASAEGTSTAMQFGLNVGLSRALYETDRHLSLATADLLVRRSFTMGFRPDPMEAWIFGLGLFYDGFTCPECKRGSIRGPERSAAQ